MKGMIRYGQVVAGNLTYTRCLNTAFDLRLRFENTGYGQVGW